MQSCMIRYVCVVSSYCHASEAFLNTVNSVPNRHIKSTPSHELRNDNMQNISSVHVNSSDS